MHIKNRSSFRLYFWRKKSRAWVSAVGKGLLAPSLTRGIVWLDRALALAQACLPHLREHIVVSFAKQGVYREVCI